MRREGDFGSFVVERNGIAPKWRAQKYVSDLDLMGSSMIRNVLGV